MVDQLVASAETVLQEPAAEGLYQEEIERVLAWVERPETRLVKVSAIWSLPARGAGRWSELLSQIELSRQGADPFDNHRRLRPESRPARVPFSERSNLSSHEPGTVRSGTADGASGGDRAVPAATGAGPSPAGAGGHPELHASARWC